MCGSIFVNTSRLDSSFAINGPLSFTGGGRISLLSHMPAGTYTVTYGAVSGYVKPFDQTLVLKRGATITFVGNYRRLIFAGFPGLGTSANDSTGGIAQLVCEITVAFPRNSTACIASSPLRVEGTAANTFDWNSPNEGFGSATDFITSQIESPEDLVAVVGHSY